MNESLLKNADKIIEFQPPNNFNIKTYKPYYRVLYEEVIVKKLMEKYQYNNITMIPKLKNISVSMSISTKDGRNEEKLSKMYHFLAAITGVLPTLTRTRCSIAKFKTVANSITGCMVVMRNNNMYLFFERLVEMVLLNIKGFNGFSSNSINKNSFNIGLTNIDIFPEVKNIGTMVIGCTISFCCYIPDTNSGVYEQTKDLLKYFNLPIKDKI